MKKLNELKDAFTRIKKFKKEDKIKQIIYAFQPHLLEKLGDDQLYVEVAKAHFFVGQFQLCIARCNAAISINARNASAFYTLGLAFLKNAEFLNSEDSFRQALSLGVFDAQAFYDKSLINIEQGNLSAAKEAILITEELKFNRGKIRYVYSLYHFARSSVFLKDNKPFDALLELSLITTGNTTTKYANLVRQASELLMAGFYEENQYLVGIGVASDLIDKVKANIHLIYERARLYERMNETSKAIVDYKKCIAYKGPSFYNKNYLAYKVKLLSRGNTQLAGSDRGKEKSMLVLGPDQFDFWGFIRVGERAGFNVKFTSNIILAYQYLEQVRPNIFVSHLHLSHNEENEYDKVKDLTFWVKKHLPDTLVIIHTIGFDNLSNYYYHYRDPDLKEVFDIFKDVIVN